MCDQSIIRASPLAQDSLRFTWNPRSTRRDPIKAVFRLEKPEVQNPLGIEAPLSYAADSVQSWPPFWHSHAILSLLRDEGIHGQTQYVSNECCPCSGSSDPWITYPLWSCTIIMIPRIPHMTSTKGQRNLQTRVKVIERCDRRQNIREMNDVSINLDKGQNNG